MFSTSGLLDWQRTRHQVVLHRGLHHRNANHCFRAHKTGHTHVAVQLSIAVDSYFPNSLVCYEPQWLDVNTACLKNFAHQRSVKSTMHLELRGPASRGIQNRNHLSPPIYASVGDQSPRKNSGSHIDASHSRQPLVKGERLVRYEVNAVIQSQALPGNSQI